MRPALALLACLPLAAMDDAAARDALIRSLAGAPDIQAAHERHHAALRSMHAAGRLPDPMIGAGAARRSSAMDSWPMYEVMLEQPLPRWGERDAMRAKAQADAAMEEAELLEALGETAAEVATMLAEACAARARLTVIEGQIARAEAVRSVAAARVAAGNGDGAEQLAAHSRQAALAVERDTIRRMAIDAEQEARARLGLEPDAPLPAFAAPDRSIIDPQQAPGIRAAQARNADADAMFREARAGRYPETSIGLRYEWERQPGDPMDTIGLQFRMSLPVWQGASADLEEAAQARGRAARRDADGWRLKAQAMLARADRAAAVAATARRTSLETRARLDAEYEAALRGAASQPGASLGAVLDVLDRLGEADVQVIEAETAARQAAASLWRLAPPGMPQRNQP